LFSTKSLYTKAGFQVHQNIHWELFTDDQCEAVVASAVELLERTGIEVASDLAQQIFAQGGCRVNGSRVRIPSSKINWALAVAPDRLTICDREGSRALRLETNNVYFGAAFYPQEALDIASGELRPFVLADVEATAKLTQSLPNVDFSAPGGLPTDVPKRVGELEALKAQLTYTTKPVIQPVRKLAQAKAAHEMASIVAGSQESFAWDPFIVLHTTIGETLSLSADTTDILMFAAEKRIPAIASNELVCGLTAPSTSAAAIIAALANSLASLLLVELVREGAPFIAGGFFTFNDVKNGLYPYGAPEVSLLGAGLASVLRYLRLPSFGFGGATDSKTSDAQLGLESAFSILHAGLAGTNLVYGAGILDSGGVSSAVSLVMAEELMAITRRIMRGVEMDEDRLARGVIDDVQPGGHYLGSKHTRYYFKSEQFWPTLMNRKRIDDWTAEGEKTLGQRSKEKTLRLLESFDGPVLDGAQVTQLQAVVDKAAGK